MSKLTRRNREWRFPGKLKAASDYALRFPPFPRFDLLGHVCKHLKTLRFPETFPLEFSQLSLVQVLRLSPFGIYSMVGVLSLSSSLARQLTHLWFPEASPEVLVREGLGGRKLRAHCSPFQNAAVALGTASDAPSPPGSAGERLMERP